MIRDGKFYMTRVVMTGVSLLSPQSDDSSALQDRQFTYPVVVVDGAESHVSAEVAWTLAPGCYSNLAVWVSFDVGPGLPYVVDFREWVAPPAGPYSWAWNGRGHHGYYNRLYFYTVRAVRCDDQEEQYRTDDFVLVKREVV